MSLGATCMARPAGSGQGQTPFPCPVRRRHPADAGEREAHSRQRPAPRHRHAAGRGAGRARHARSGGGTHLVLVAVLGPDRALLRHFGQRTHHVVVIFSAALGGNQQQKHGGCRPWEGEAGAVHRVGARKQQRQSVSRPARCRPARRGGADKLGRQRGGTRARRVCAAKHAWSRPASPGTSPSHARPGSRPAGAARWAGRGAGARRMRCTASRRAAGAVPGHTPGSAISGAAACRIVAAARLAAAPAGRCSLQRSLPHHHSSSQRARRAWFVAQGVRGAEPVKLSEFLGRDAVGHARRALAGARRAPRELRRRERRTRGRKRGAPRGARSWAPRPALVSTADPFTPPSRTGRAAGVCGARRRVAGRRGRGSGRRQRTDGPVGARGRTRRDRVGKFAAPAGRAGGAGPRRRQRHSR